MSFGKQFPIYKLYHETQENTTFHNDSLKIRITVDFISLTYTTTFIVHV